MSKPEKPRKTNKNVATPMKYIGLASAIGIDLAACTLGAFIWAPGWTRSWEGPDFGSLSAFYSDSLSAA